MKIVHIRKVAVMCLITGLFFEIRWRNKKKIAQIENEKNRFKNQFDILCQWHRNNLQGCELEKILIERDIRTVAIYGKGIIGRLIYKTLENTSVRVSFFIDKNAENIVQDLNKTIRIDSIKEEQKPDAIIVSLPYDFQKIKQDLHSLLGLDYQILSIEGLIYKI